MGIPKLNKLLLERCPDSIKKVHLDTLRSKKIAVDISIYLYKFLSDGDYMEHLYLFLSMFKYYCIIPIFIFDGKPPVEKNALLKRRYSDKQQAHREYMDIEERMITENDKQKITEMVQTMKILKKKMVRITYREIEKAIELISAFGYEHYFAPHEADQLCVYLTCIGKTYATLSDDMDMIVSGCPIVLRNLSLMNREVSLYDTNQILSNLQLTIHEFRDIIVISGTDYDISTNSVNITVKKAFEYYTKYKESKSGLDFYSWLNETGAIENRDLNRISYLLNIDNYMNEYMTFINENIMVKPKFSISNVKNIMRQYKFIFV